MLPDISSLRTPTAQYSSPSNPSDDIVTLLGRARLLPSGETDSLPWETARKLGVKYTKSIYFLDKKTWHPSTPPSRPGFQIQFVAPMYFSL